MSTHEQVQEVMREVMMEAGADLQIALSPTLIAMRTYDRFQEGAVDIHVQWGCVEHYKALARRMLAREYDPVPDDDQIIQGDFFSGELQDRYPVQRGPGDQPLYKPRNQLSASDLTWNIEKLRKAGSALIRHADALIAFRDGQFPAVA